MIMRLHAEQNLGAVFRMTFVNYIFSEKASCICGSSGVIDRTPMEQSIQKYLGHNAERVRVNMTTLCFGDAVSRLPGRGLRGRLRWGRLDAPLHMCSTATATITVAAASPPVSGCVPVDWPGRTLSYCSEFQHHRRSVASPPSALLG